MKPFQEVHLIGVAGPDGKCGICIKNAIEKGKAPLASC